MRLVNDSGLGVQQLLRISHMSGGQPHYLALLGEGRYICDCCMGVNIGVPCRHYFQALTAVPGLLFNIALIRPRWLQDPNCDTTAVEPVAFGGASALPRRNEIGQHTLLSPIGFSNPLDQSRRTPSPITETLNSRTVLFETQALIKTLTAGNQTREELNNILAKLEGVR